MDKYDTWELNVERLKLEVRECDAWLDRLAIDVFRAKAMRRAALKRLKELKVVS